MNIETNHRIRFSHYPRKLVLVRHGQSEFNKVNITIGLDSSQKDQFSDVSDQKVTLTDLGVSQAVLTGKVLCELGLYFDLAYHSGYVRTKSTLKHILDGLPVNTVIENFNLRERETGYTLGMTRQEMKNYFPFLDSYFKKNGQFFSRPIGGESLCDLYNRITQCLSQIFTDTQEKNVLISTHGRVIQVIRFILEDGWSLDNIENFLSLPGPENCSVTTYDYLKEDEGMILREYNKVFYGV